MELNLDLTFKSPSTRVIVWNGTMSLCVFYHGVDRVEFTLQQ
jgi:hypothetical protein